MSENCQGAKFEDPSLAPALNLTPNTKAQHMAKYSTPLAVIFAVVLTVATGATLVELNRRGRAEFDELATRLSDLDAKYQLLYRDLRGEMFARNAALRKELTERIAQSSAPKP